MVGGILRGTKDQGTGVDRDLAAVKFAEMLLGRLGPDDETLEIFGGEVKMATDEEDMEEEERIWSREAGSPPY